MFHSYKGNMTLISMAYLTMRHKRALHPQSEHIEKQWASHCLSHLYTSMILESFTRIKYTYSHCGLYIKIPRLLWAFLTFTSNRAESGILPSSNMAIIAWKGRKEPVPSPLSPAYAGWCHGQTRLADTLPSSARPSPSHLCSVCHYLNAARRRSRLDKIDKIY